MVKRVLLVNLLACTETPLANDARVLFILPNGAEVEVSHAGRQDHDGTLVVRVRNGEMRVIPRANNMAEIEVNDATDTRRKYTPARLPGKR